MEIQKHDVLCLGQRQESVLRCLTLAAKPVWGEPGGFSQPLACIRILGCAYWPVSASSREMRIIKHGSVSSKASVPRLAEIDVLDYFVADCGPRATSLPLGIPAPFFTSRTKYDIMT